MSILVLQVFVSLMLVAGSVVLFVYTVKSGTLEHADRLALAPLEDDAPSSGASGAGADPVVASAGAPPEARIQEEIR